jgi:hypothetical protein
MANLLPEYRSSNYGTHPYQQEFTVPSNATPSAIYQYPQNPQFVGQTRPQYDSSFTQQYPDAFLQNQQTRQSQQSYTTPSGYQAPHVHTQQQFTTQPYYQHQQQQQQAQNYAVPYTQPHAQNYAAPYTQPHAAFNPYGQSYVGRHNPNQLPDQMRQGATYYFGPAVQTGGEGLLAGTSPTSGSYTKPPGPGRLSCSKGERR